MPTPIGYFFYPFSNTGNTADIPVDTQLNGSISYNQGYGPNYELNILTNPSAFPIGRTTMNQLFYEITYQLQQYSQFGVPAWITSVQNQGTAFEYPIYSRVRYNDVVYENQVAANTATPGTDNTWLAISGDSTGVLPGVMLDYAGTTPPAGYLSCDGSAVSRTAYAVLLGVLTQTQTGTTTNTLNTITGLTDTSQMYVDMDLECANFPSGTTVASIVNSTDITVSNTATASGAISIQFFNWGNGDGSTTFNVPDLRRYVTIGQGGTPYDGVTAGQITGTKVGQFGGEEAHTQTVGELATHSHPLASGSGLGIAQVVTTNNNTSGPITGNTGSSTPFNVMQKSTIVYKIIKY